jgi:hypothetical protein
MCAYEVAVCCRSKLRHACLHVRGSSQKALSSWGSDELSSSSAETGLDKGVATAQCLAVLTFVD